MLYRTAADFKEWRNAARPLLHAGIAADRVVWTNAGDLRGAESTSEVSVEGGTTGTVTISHTLLQLLETISFHRHPGRWS